MRNAFAAAITELAAVDPRVVLLSGDIGNRLFDEFKQRAPQRFYNCGVAEANMTTMAAGMALCDLRPFVYTITTFATSRVFEQLRIDVAYQGAPVVIVGTGSGLSYASLGPTHHSCEDVALLRLLPGMTVLCPADATEVREAVNAVMSLYGPAYIRLGKKGEPTVHQKPTPFVIGRGIILREGRHVCLLGTGNMVATALDAADMLNVHGLSACVVSMHTVKPLDEELLAEAFDRFAIVAVIEEHNLMGGLGSAVAQWLSVRHPRPTSRFLAFGTPDVFMCQSGSQKYARQLFGLTPGAIARQIVQTHAEGKQPC